MKFNFHNLLYLSQYIPNIPCVVNIFFSVHDWESTCVKGYLMLYADFLLHWWSVALTLALSKGPWYAHLPLRTLPLPFALLGISALWLLPVLHHQVLAWIFSTYEPSSSPCQPCPNNQHLSEAEGHQEWHAYLRVER